MVEVFLTKFGKERAHFSTRGHVFWQKGHVFFAFFCALRGSVFLWDHFFASKGTFSGRKSALPDQNRLKGAQPKIYLRYLRGPLLFRGLIRLERAESI